MEYYPIILWSVLHGKLCGIAKAVLRMRMRNEEKKIAGGLSLLSRKTYYKIIVI